MSWYLAPQLVPRANSFYRALEQAGLKPRITSATRSRQEQAILYERYLRGMSRLPAAPPGRSLHERGLAFDIVTTNPAVAGAMWGRMGGRWFASDPVHFEVRS